MWTWFLWSKTRYWRNWVWECGLDYSGVIFLKQLGVRTWTWFFWCKTGYWRNWVWECGWFKTEYWRNGVWGCGLNSSGVRQSLLVGSCEHSYQPSSHPNGGYCFVSWVTVSLWKWVLLHLLVYVTFCCLLSHLIKGSGLLGCDAVLIPCAPQLLIISALCSFKFLGNTTPVTRHILGDLNPQQNCYGSQISLNPYPTAFPYGNGMVLHFYQQQESSTTKTVHKVINKRLKAYV